jgi:paraquat-inducible protein B
MTQTAVVKKNRGISAIWTLPLVALCICGWLVYSAYKNAGVDISISFADATGIVPEKTQIMARGIPIGMVKELHPDLSNNQVKVIAKIEKEATSYLVEDTEFWVVRPEMSASSIQGLDTILSGSYIGIQTGTATTPRSEFAGLSSAPPVSADTPGLHLKIRAEALGSIQGGTGVYYRNIEIGKVQNYQLQGDDVVFIDVFIEARYIHLVREGSRFCNASGIQIGGKLPNLKVKVESLASLLRGGILLHTPEQLQNSPQAKNGHIFSLYPDFESANFGIPMTLTLASSEDIVEGSTKVMYRGLEAGFVKDININDDAERTVTANILLDPRAELILRQNTRFWLVKPEISPSGINNLRLLLSGAHITFQPGDGDFRNHFDILPDPPPQTPLRPGRTFILTSAEPIDLSAKSPVYYKNIQVGEVIDVDIGTSGGTLRTTVFIYEKYLGFLSTQSVFWVQSGIELSASLSEGLAVSTGPLAKMLQGGVSFITPGTLKRQKPDVPEEDFIFPLHTSYKDAVAAVPALQPAGIHFVVAADDAQSLAIGSPILHKNIKIGEIEGLRLSRDQQKVLLECMVMDEYRKIVHDKTRFYNSSGLQVSGGLNGIQVRTGSLQSIVSGGLGCINPMPGTKSARTDPYPLFASLEEAQHADEVLLTVLLTDTYGLKEGSPIRYKGIEVGTITGMAFAENLRTITATVRVDKNAASLFRADTRVWVEKAEVGLAGVKNVETLVFGSYLNVFPGNGPPARMFAALPEPPRTEIAGRDGLGIVLETRHLGSLSTGSPVYYRQFQIGRVTGYELSPTFQKVHVFINIAEPYKAVVRKNTRFWNVSGTRIEGGVFSGLTVSTESLEAFMRGGIALATPDQEQTGPPVPDGQHFPLFDAPEKEWLDWNPDVVLLEYEQSRQLPNPKDK